MASNLIYYGISLGLGFIFSFAYGQIESKKHWWLFLTAAITMPPLWTLSLAGMNIEELNTLSKIGRLYDIERNYGIYSGKFLAAIGLVPFLWSFLTGTLLLNEREKIIEKRNRDSLKYSKNPVKPRKKSPKI